MGNRRMFSVKVTESDAFYSLPVSAQALYMHLCMLADEDGMINNAMSAVNRISGGKSALRCLVERRFLLQFNDVFVVKHWRIANSLKNDRLKPLAYPDIAKRIWVKSNRAYTDHPVEGCKTLYEAKSGIQMESGRNPNGILTEPNRTEPNKNRTEELESGFDVLWNRYPDMKRGSKTLAKTAYSQIITDEAKASTALENLEVWKQSEQWTKADGQYIPLLENWLVREQWTVKPAKLAVPQGASGQLGEAELEAIRRVLAEPVEPLEEEG